MWWFKEVVESKLPFSAPFPGSSLTGLSNFTNTTLICRLYKKGRLSEAFALHVLFGLDLITCRTDIFSFFKNSYYSLTLNATVVQNGKRSLLIHDPVIQTAKLCLPLPDTY